SLAFGEHVLAVMPFAKIFFGSGLNRFEDTGRQAGAGTGLLEQVGADERQLDATPVSTLAIHLERQQFAAPRSY
ncbi:MAG TPA: hypothetical protein VL135_06335, partial [Terracidiphilus sp.]|nr:hypothetical protein [Terracidiphilus sp.]